MTNRRKSNSIGAILILLLAIMGVLAASAFLAIDQIPKWAEQQFGPASTQLDIVGKVIYSARLYFEQENLLLPVKIEGEEFQFTVEPGESVDSVAFRLENLGIIRSADAFTLFLVYSGLDTGIQAGNFRIKPGLNAVDVAHELQDATPSDVTFVILAGWRAEEIAAALPSSGLQFSAEEFLALVNNPSLIDIPESLGQLNSLEGFLFPDTYIFPRTTTAREFVTAIISRFDLQVNPEIRQAIEQQGLTLVEAVTLASIVEREAVQVEEQPMIASVFYNRLAVGAKLDSDPTVQYAVGYNEQQHSWWTNPLTLDDLQVDSPYNTYIYSSLPPGPISNPGLSALRAVAYPAKSPYLYFRARCDGSGFHAFATTYQEHLDNACP